DFFLEEIEDFLKDESIPSGIEDSFYDPKGDILYLEKLLNDDPSQLPPMDLKQAEETKAKSSIKEPPELELKELPSHLEYAFLEETDKLPVIIAKDLKDIEKEALLKVLKSHKRAIAWKIFDIKDIDPRFFTHKILMEEDYKPAIQTRGKLKDATRKDHFSLPFMDQMLERLTGNEFYCFLDGFSGYFQIPIDPQDQEKTTFTSPYETFAYRRVPFGLCNAPENLTADHLSRLENPHKDVLENKDINENFPLETLGSLSSGSTPWFADIANFHAGNFIKKGLTSQQKKKFSKDFARVMTKYWVTHHLATAYHPQTSGQVEVFNRGLKRILKRTVGENRASWSDKLDDALWAFRTAFKTSIGCTPYKLTAGDHRKLQLNELNELRDQAYENSLIYKERIKKLHDSKFKNLIFNVGDQVLLFNSRLKIFSRKLKTRWSGPFTITQVFPYGIAELSQSDGPNFKVNGHRVKHYYGGTDIANITRKRPKLDTTTERLVEIVLFIVDSGCSKHMIGNLKLLINFVEKFLGTVKFRNDHIAPILGYGDLVQGAVTIKKVYYVEGLNYNLFSVGQFCDTDLEVAFRKSTCFIRDLKGNDLLTAWLWHRRLSHLNFDTINLLLKNDIVVGLPKLKFVKDHLCSSYELGKAKRKSFHTKLTPSSKRRLQLLHMDLCGPMRVASINGKRYVLACPKRTSSLKGIHHQTSVAQTPEQNGVVKRWNRTLVEATRTIDGENLDKMKEKGDECIFVGYSTQSRAYRVFNKITRVIMESIHVNFDELPQMALDQLSSDPAPECQTMTLNHNSLSPANQRQTNVPQADRTVTTSNELDLLFSLMFDELLNGSSKVVSKSSAGIVEQAKAKQPLDNALDFNCKYAQRIHELLVYVQDKCSNAINLSEKKVVVTPKNNVKKVRIEVFY
nr:reverse transcriptase domain-containing protein [Tanacetum cinerariifolium]